MGILSLYAEPFVMPVTTEAVVAADLVSINPRVMRASADRDVHVARALLHISSSNLETGALVLRRLRDDRPEIEIRQREIGVPRGLVALREGELDVLLGDAAAAPDTVAVEPLRQETVQVMLAADHPCAAQPAVPVAALADEVWLLPQTTLLRNGTSSFSGTARRPASVRAATREQRGGRPRRPSWPSSAAAWCRPTPGSRPGPSGVPAARRARRSGSRGR